MYKFLLLAFCFVGKNQIGMLLFFSLCVRCMSDNALNRNRFKFWFFYFNQTLFTGVVETDQIFFKCPNVKACLIVRKWEINEMRAIQLKLDFTKPIQHAEHRGCEMAHSVCHLAMYCVVLNWAHMNTQIYKIHIQTYITSLFMLEILFVNFFHFFILYKNEK